MNPWMTGDKAQQEWYRKWAHEQKVCEQCGKQCTAYDRLYPETCDLLKQRSGGGDMSVRQITIDELMQRKERTNGNV